MKRLRLNLRKNRIRRQRMALTDVVKIILLVLLVVCAIAVNFTKTLLQAVIVFMSYSSVMCIIWVLMESPDLAITEAAVGAGISGVLFLLTLRRIRSEDDRREEERRASGKSDKDEPDGGKFESR
jgi:uncharacterized MnhB-related membrane protein